MKCIHIREDDFEFDKMDLIPLGDIHYGAKECDYKKVQEMVDWIRDNPKARVILMGDIMNLGSKDSIGGGVFDDIIDPQEQYEQVLELLKPIKDKIYGYLVGNHEENRIRAKTSVDLSKNLCRELGIKFAGFGAFFKIKLGINNYIIYATHGSSGALLPHTKMNTVLKLANHFNANIFLHGHVHELGMHKGLYYGVNNRHANVEERKRYFILTGSYLDYKDSYAEFKNYGPTRKGSPKIKLYRDKFDIHVSI